MVALYVDGTKVGTLADAERLLPQLLAGAKAIELRHEPSGRKVGTVTPETLGPALPDLTEEDVQRLIAEPGSMSLAEFRKKIGRA